MSQFLEFNCPSCGHANLVDPADVPEHGVSRACQSCNASTFVSRAEAEAGTVHAAPIEPEVETEREWGSSEREHGMGLQLKVPSGSVENLSLDAIQHGVQSQRVRPWDLASEDGRTFHPICEHTEFRTAFVSSDFAPMIGRKCINHQDADPAGTCSRCGRSYCQTCLSSLMQMQPRLCPACSATVKDPDPRLKELPVWKRIREFAMYPIDKGAWMGTLAVGLLLLLAGSATIMTPLYLIVLAALVYVLLRSAKGDKTWTPSLSIDFKELFEKIVPLTMLTVAVGLPLAAVRFIFGPAMIVTLQFPLAFLMFLYYPMAVGLVVLEPDKQKALRPRPVLRAIWALKEDYIVLLVMLVVVASFVLAIRLLLSYIPALGGPSGTVAAAYGLVLQAHVLGWLLYMNRERILTAV